MEFALIGKLKSSKQKIESTINNLGGTLVTKIHEKLAAVISNEDEIQKMGPKMAAAKACDIQVVSEDFLTEAEKMDPCRYIICRSLSEWGGNVSHSQLILNYFDDFLNRIFFFLVAIITN